jgi:hypothetical protein
MTDDELVNSVSALVREYVVQVFSPDGRLIKYWAFCSLRELIEWAQNEKLVRLSEIEDYL